MSHCEGCPFMSCHDCAYKGGTEPGGLVPQPDSGGVEGSAQRANRAVVWDNKQASNEAGPAGNRALTTSPAKES